MTRRQTPARALAALIGIAGVACLAVPAVASPSTTAPGAPTGIHVTKVSSTSFTVGVHTAPHATTYRVYVATNRGALAVANLPSDKWTGTSKRPSVTVKGLHFSTAPYYYRVETLNGSERRFSLPASEIGLKPATPTGLSASSSAKGTYLTWNSVNSTGFTVEQATDPRMKQNVHTYSIDGQERQFTPLGLNRGTTYYFRIRSTNIGTPSSYSSVVQATGMANEQPVSVMSYNVLEATNDGRSEGGNTVAPWSERGPAIAKIIRQASPDVIGIQEAASWVGAVKGPREIDSLKSLLDGEYSLAKTEIPPSQPHYLRTGVYILYKPTVYKAVGNPGHWNIGNTRWAAYQILKKRATGAKFLFVSAHLLYTPGRTSDQRREAETKNLLTLAGRLAASAGVPIVYTGDFNSDQFAAHAFNGVAKAMLAAHVDDAWDVAKKHTRAMFNTAEGYKRVPPKNGARIDYVFAPPGVGVQSWGLEMNLSHGKFVGVIPSDHNALVSDVVFPY
jgi:endonuclease/exonuclease/phosphatase family metal-dependent hydrolase